MDSRATLPFTPRQLPQAVRDETLMRTLFECSIILAVVPGISDIPLHSSMNEVGELGERPPDHEERRWIEAAVAWWLCGDIWLWVRTWSPKPGYVDLPSMSARVSRF